MTGRSPASERACDGAVLAFATWTLCCHAVVAAGGAMAHLLGLVAAVALAALALRARRRRGADARDRPPPPVAEPPPARRRAPLPGWLEGGALVAGLAASAAVAWHADVVGLWGSALALLGLGALARVLPEPPRAAPPARGPALERGLWALAGICAVLALVANRPDVDDSFYVNVAVTAADHPWRPLLAEDALHGIAGLPLHQPVYRVNSYELLNGALSLVTGIPAIYVFHLGATALAALLVPLAWARLLRLLEPRLWLAAVAALVLVLLAVGETHRWYGNFAFVRIWQGKAIYLFVWLPLVYAYAIEFALRPGRSRWWRLAAAQVAAVGCSSSAIWAGPGAALLAAACAVRPSRAGLRTLALCALSSAYVLGAGWLLMQGDIEAHDPLLERARIRAEAKPRVPGRELASALTAVLGAERLHFVGMAALMAGWTLCRRGLGQRFAVVVPLGATALLLNPFLERWVTGVLTGPSYWRVMWSVPVPLLLALALVAPLRLEGTRTRRALGRVAAAALVLAFAAFVPRYSALSARNRPVELDVDLRLGLPSLKVPRGEYRSWYEWAGLLNRSAPPGATVLAPEYVAAWVPTYHRHVHPLVVRESYLRKYLDRLGRDEVRPRRVMARYAGGSVMQTGAEELFREGLDRFGVRAVCLAVTQRAPRAREILRQAGYHRTEQGVEHEIWVRD